MFGVGLMELAVIALVAVIALGPERLPELARQAGQLIKQARTFAHSARDELRTELGPEYADLELRDLDPRNIVRKHIAEAMSDTSEPAPSHSHAPAGAAALAGGLPPYDVEAT